MTIPVDWDVEQQNKQTNKQTNKLPWQELVRTHSITLQSMNKRKILSKFKINMTTRHNYQEGVHKYRTMCSISIYLFIGNMRRQ